LYDLDDGASTTISYNYMFAAVLYYFDRGSRGEWRERDKFNISFSIWPDTSTVILAQGSHLCGMIADRHCRLGPF